MPISFDISGFQTDATDSWIDPETGDRVIVQYFALVPDLPAPLEDLDTLRRRLCEVHASSGSLIEASVISVDGQPALLRVEKMPRHDQPSGLLFAASIVIPKDRCSIALMMFCEETGTTGIREAVTMELLGSGNFFTPHPYAPDVQGQLPYNRSDDMEWDNALPDHPLTRLRRLVARIAPTIRLDPEFAALPPFRAERRRLQHALRRWFGR
ncbi:hypothetical protein [Nocardia sp. NPDC051981]|uniref:hypothetical protein n=1 Tax=Nocardia sp. NPDC051981 TaxID=3155417 RepID=UPI00341B9394